MVVIYFSGTGNSRYVAELFCNEYDEGAKAFSIEDDDITQVVKMKKCLYLHIRCNIVQCQRYCVIL